MYPHDLPYKWNLAFNRCIAELPLECRIKTRNGHRYIRYRKYADENSYTSCPYRPRRKRYIWTDHRVEFNGHSIEMQAVVYDFVGR